VKAIHRHPAKRKIIDPKENCAKVDGEKGGKKLPRLRFGQLIALPKPN
jgi:hypothetical protein